MSKINRNHVFTAAAAFGAVALFSMLSFGSNAEASTSVASCRGPTAAKVVSCCEEITEKKGRPLWMLQTGKNCQSVTVCRGRGTIGLTAVNFRRCYIQVLYKVKEGGGEMRDNNPRGGPNSIR